MFNEEFKEWFMNEQKIEDSTRKLYTYFFNKAEKTTEEDLDKDIYELNPNECDQLLYSFFCSSAQVVSVIVSCFKRYLDFAIQNNHVKDYFNYFATIRGIEDCRRYVNKQVNKYITLEDLYEYENVMYNAQDKVILRLLFNSIKGEKAEEILNLKMTDVTEDKIILPNREVKISNSTYELIKEAFNEKEYIKANGEKNDAKSGSRTLLPSEYILKSSGSSIGKMTYSTLSMRLYTMKDYLGNPYLNITNIWLSGMLHQLKEIKKIKGELDKEDYEIVKEMFDYKEPWNKVKDRFITEL